MKPIRLHRRTLLRGLGGVAVGLPVLECMLNEHGTQLAYAKNEAIPRRYGLVFAGQALGGDNYAKNEQRIAGDNFTEEGHFLAPQKTGSGYGLTTPLQPLAALQSDFSVVSNLAIPFNRSSAEGDQVPAGGAFRDFHGGGCSPLLCGTRSTSPNFRCASITSDQVVAEHYRGQTAVDSLVYRAQPSWYLSGSSFAGRQYLSYDGEAKRIEAQVSPTVAFESLFDNFVPAGAMPGAASELRRQARLSILDVISDKRERVLQGLSVQDRTRLSRHFDEIRALEKKLENATTAAGVCEVPPAPGMDPSIGGNNAGSGSDDIAENTGYSDEAARARTLADLVHMAFVCDLTRSFTLQLTVFQSHMNVFQLTSELGRPMRADLHEVGHNGDANNRGQLAVSTCLSWHIGHYAYLLDKLKQSPEGDGSVLDNSAILFTAEAGHGTQLNDATTENQTHSVEQMALLLAGRAGGLAPGRHLDAAGAHPAQVMISAMNAVGVETDKLGEVNGAFPGVFAG